MSAYAKAIYAAIVGFVIAFLTAILPYLQNGETMGEVNTLGWVTAILAGLVSLGVTGGGVYAISNKPTITSI